MNQARLVAVLYIKGFLTQNRMIGRLCFLRRLTIESGHGTAIRYLAGLVLVSGSVAGAVARPDGRLLEDSESTSEGKAERRHAGANDSDVNLNDGPFGDGRVVPGLILGGRERYERVKTEDTDDSDESADEEH